MTPATPGDISTRERLTESLRRTVDEADQLMSKAERAGSDQFSGARDRFESQLRRAKDELRRLEASAIENAKRAARATDETVHEHPYAAMGLAAGVGLLLGMLISRR